jgi:hypothetical protein
MKRVLFAAALSAAVYGTTEWWYRHTAFTNDGPINQTPIASVYDVQKDVERRPVTKLIWQSLTDGDPVYANETIRTGSETNTGVKVQFIGGKYITLDADTLVTISSNNNEISLDLLDGSLFVAQNEKAIAPGAPDSPSPEASAMTLTLKSGDKKVDLTQATAQLSKSKGDKVDVQVLKGKATVEEGGKTSQEISAGQQLSSIDILLPKANAPFFFDPEKPEPVLFRWKGLAPNSKVSLWTGPSRRKLTEFREVSKINETEMTAQLDVGAHFWKLVASTDKGNVESGIRKIDIGTGLPPKMLFPLADSDLVKDKEPFTVDFRWTIPELSQDIMLEIAKDSLLEDSIVKKRVGSENNSYRQNLEPGIYYWRASAEYQGLKNTIPAKVVRFEVRSPSQVKLPPVAIEWSNPTESAPQYFVKEPIASWAWKTEQKDQVKMWRLNIAKDEQSLREPSSTNPAEVFQTMELNYKTPLKEAGKYVAFVEALGADNQVLAKSEPKWIEVASLPLLPSPEFQPQAGTLQSDNSGRLELNWSKVSGAKEYWLTLYDKSGNKMRTSKFIGTTTALSNLLPGNYKVGIVAIDEHGRESLKEEARIVEVPDKSALSAPKLKKIKVN